jgi:hypothetical protein
MKFTYSFDPNQENLMPTVSPAKYDVGFHNPTELWENDCGATEKTCQGHTYFGGYNECAQGHSFWRKFEASRIHPETNRLVLTGKIWTIDSWDGETFTITMTAADGSEIATKSWQGNNFANLADQTVQCEGSVQGWHDGFFEITVAANYNINMGDVTVKITNTLD